MIRETQESDCVMVREAAAKHGHCVFWHNGESPGARRAVVPETVAKLQALGVLQSNARTVVWTTSPDSARTGFSIVPRSSRK